MSALQGYLFSSDETVLAHQQSCGKFIQPFMHCDQTYFPKIASKFDLQRYIPDLTIPLNSRGPPCALGVVGRSGDCYRSRLPDFLYTYVLLTLIILVIRAGNVLSALSRV